MLLQYPETQERPEQQGAVEEQVDPDVRHELTQTPEVQERPEQQVDDALQDEPWVLQVGVAGAVHRPLLQTLEQHSDEVVQT